jgi:HlyD family secretion protein
MRRYVLPLTAAILVVFAAGYALHQQRPAGDRPPPLPPPESPFGHTVAGLGMIEPATEASGTAVIAVGSQVAGVVTRVHVRMGQEVKAGELLFEQDSRTAQANLQAARAALQVARENLRKLELQPRPEEVPVTEAQANSAERNLKMLRDTWERNQRLIGTGAVTEQDLVISRQAYEVGLAALDQARASLALLKAGAWEPDKAVARASLEQARAQVLQAETALALLRVQAPSDGTILQVNVRPGEYVTVLGGQSLILMGNLKPLHVRVSVDQEDVARLKLYAPARARVRGDPQRRELPLSFVRLEPYVVPKTSLTGANTERVDTRVVQVIYALDPENEMVRDQKVLVGQLVDVFIDTGP